MDANSNQTNNGTATNTASGSSKPPSWVWVLVALASALTIGVLLFGAYQFIRRRRAPRLAGDAEGDAVSRGGGGSTRGSRQLWARRRRRSRSQPGASRWGWVYPHHTNRASTQSSEGLNELGEAPPPYNEDDLEPCLSVDMAEVHALGLGEGPSRVASRQDRESLVGGAGPGQLLGHPEPPAYDFAVHLGSTTLVQQPAPAVVSESRVT
ncbi:hypothetical protein INS49_012418 [Diaporthe citri]|uniref:uncharacterized protein n=1 Tax=Diaporthe citri TaxID=83186 RepID=UPI001C7E45BF|nr:uncharacterized protein INS49_012418 [Diaporthe citri]KAG6358898.1 hypothetical protein INS49_012418 [Diaporthe citri]